MNIFKKHLKGCMKSELYSFNLYDYSGKVVYYKHPENDPNFVSRIVYYQNGMIHNEFGPAIIYLNGKISYYIKNKKISELEFKYLL